MKKISRIVIAFAIVFSIALSYFLPLTKVIANVYGNGEVSKRFNVRNEDGFTIHSVTINGDPWSNDSDEYHSATDVYTVVINVSPGDEKYPNIMYCGGDCGSHFAKSVVVDEETGAYIYTITVTNMDGNYVDLGVVEGPPIGEEHHDDEPRFDGRAYVVWSCGTGVCYHYFENIPDFDDGNSTFYRASEVTADNKEGEIFDVGAEYRGWYLADTFEDWQDFYEAATEHEVDWDTMDPELILGEPNQHIGELIDEVLDSGACENNDEFEYCLHMYAAEHNHEVWTHQLQPLGEPDDNNAYVSYGDRNFKVVIYNDEFKGVAMGDLSKLSYYPAQWTNPFIKRDHFDISGSTKDKPALLDSILLEENVRIKALGYNSFEIASIEALDVPEDAVTISKDEDDFVLTFSSNYYDHVVFKVTDTEGKVSYMLIKRYTIDGWIKFVDNHPVLTADFYFDRRNSYEDFDLTAKIVYKDGTSKNVTLTPVFGIDDGLNNITEAYEVDEEWDEEHEQEWGPSGKGLKRATFGFALEDGEDREIQDVYLNAEYKGSTATNYAGAYSGSGEGTPANLYHPEEEE